MFKKCDEEKMKMDENGNDERDASGTEIPRASSYFNPQRATPVYGDSPLSRVSLRSEFSPSSSFSNGFCSSEDSTSPFSSQLDETTKYQTPNLSYVNELRFDSGSPEFRFKKADDVDINLVDDLCLSESLCRMSINGREKGISQTKQFTIDQDGYGPMLLDDYLSVNGNVRCNVEKYEQNDGFCNGGFASEGLVPRSVHGFMSLRENVNNVEKHVPYEGINNGGFGCDGFKYFPRGVSSGIGDNMSPLLGFQAESNLRGFNVSGHGLSNDLGCNNTSWCNSQNSNLFDQRQEDGKSWNGIGVQLHNPSCNLSPYLNGALVNHSGYVNPGFDAFSHPDRFGMDFDPYGNGGTIDPRLAFDVNNALQNSNLLNQNTLSVPSTFVPRTHASVKGGTGNIEAFNLEDSLIIQGKSLRCAIAKQSNALKGYKKNLPYGNTLWDRSSTPGGICGNGQSLIGYGSPQVLHNAASLAAVQDGVYFMAKDQNGCRYLQKIFDEGTDLDVQIIFNEVINHIVELMMDPFGNYLVQKLLDVCTEEQRMQIVLMVTAEPGQLVHISLNTYGTRVVQKLVETLKSRSRKQIALVKSALKPGFLALIKDLNGNHVIQRCLQCLSTEDNKFIFDAATRYCVDIATHRHGCCVLQRCISHSVGQQREKLITEVSRNGLLLAQDPFGNYVVQYIIELKIPSAITNLLAQFKGHYVQLAMQKFSSHVVERCLNHCGESRPQIIGEFLSVPHFDQLLQDPFANYVIQVALAATKGPLHASLVEAVRPHVMLRTSPYCKRIFSRNLLKK